MYKTFFDTKITLHGAANSDLAVYVVFLFMFFVVIFVFVVVVIVFVVSIYFPQSYFLGRTLMKCICGHCCIFVGGGVGVDVVVGFVVDVQVVVVVVDPRNLALKMVKIRSGTAEILLAFRSLWWWW